MVFSSSVFLFAYLPLAMILYYIVPGRRAKNIWLLAISLVFYAWGEPVYIVLMLFSIAVNWLLALGISPQGNPVRSKALLAIACIANIALIGFFKYEGFLAQSINALFGTTLIPDLELPLPIGISFYTLQALSYVIDVYRQDVPPQRNILHLGMYIACFPQLIAGPIVRYQTIQDQILNRRENLEDFASGLRLFIVGLAKKVLLANTIAILATKMMDSCTADIGAVGAWAGLIAYTFQIFFDFSGYSDMAIGLGRMMGFKFLRNFNYPYIAQSAAEFWRRWHISLYTFFRDYIYIPLGGSRVTTPRWIFNTAIVWAITGLWHGAAWHYILWGVYWGILLIGEKLIWGKLLGRFPRPLRHIYAIALFTFGWLIFWVPDMSTFLSYGKALAGGHGLLGSYSLWELTIWEYLPVFVACIMASTPIVPWLKERLCAWAEGRAARSLTNDGIVNPKAIEADSLCVIDCNAQNPHRALVVQIILILCDIILIALLAISCASVASGSFNPFIYFQF